MDKNIGFSSGGPGFDSQHPHGMSVTLVLGQPAHADKTTMHKKIKKF